jgi:hypothetical protein
MYHNVVMHLVTALQGSLFASSNPLYHPQSLHCSLFLSFWLKLSLRSASTATVQLNLLILSWGVRSGLHFSAALPLFVGAHFCARLRQWSSSDGTTGDVLEVHFELDIANTSGLLSRRSSTLWTHLKQLLELGRLCGRFFFASRSFSSMSTNRAVSCLGSARSQTVICLGSAYVPQTKNSRRLKLSSLLEE